MRILFLLMMMSSSNAARVLLTVGVDGGPPPTVAAQTIDLDVDDAPLQAVIDQIVRDVGVEIVIVEGVTGRVTARLDDVAWDVALHGVLETMGLRMSRRGAAWVIEPSQ
ncbi:MAG: hypothetical protein AAFV53_43545 [Myxococcota bacterium]